MRRDQLIQKQIRKWIKLWKRSSRLSISSWKRWRVEHGGATTLRNILPGPRIRCDARCTNGWFKLGNTETRIWINIIRRNEWQLYKKYRLKKGQFFTCKHLQQKTYIIANYKFIHSFYIYTSYFLIIFFSFHLEHYFKRKKYANDRNKSSQKNNSWLCLDFKVIKNISEKKEGIISFWKGGVYNQFYFRNSHLFYKQKIFKHTFFFINKIKIYISWKYIIYKLNLYKWFVILKKSKL